MLKLAVFISGGGTNLQALIDACQTEAIDAKIAAVISNNSRAFGLERAKSAGIPAFHISKVKFPAADQYLAAIRKVLGDSEVALIVLAGYMKLLPPEVVRDYYGRIINIHPALLPKYGGQGMYGINVHQAVLAAGDKFSGATVHIVDEMYDQGPILIQRRVPVEKGDTPDTLAARVLKIEHQILPAAVALYRS
jgi:phosphoribosylglycinamide formyltransferase-1